MGSLEAQRMNDGIRYESLGQIDSMVPDKESGAPILPARSLRSGVGSGMIFTSPSNAEPLHISMAQAISIGNAYQHYVDPVVKVFHCTSSWTCLANSERLEWNGEDIDLTRPPDQCLLRAICFVTAVATEGMDLLGWPKLQGRALIERSRADAEALLAENNFMKTRELRVLQGFVLYLIALQSLGEDETVWTMLGMANRIGSSFGLPQDIGEEAVIGSHRSCYRLEMERRLWWAIIALDARITRILGRTGYLSHNFLEIPRPANVDDSELYPAMTDMPNDRPGATEAMYVRYRATLSDVLPFIYSSGNAKERSTGLLDMIEAAERRIEDEFVQHCDKSNPIQLLTFIAGRGYIIRVKLAMCTIFPASEDSAVSSPDASKAFRLAKESMGLFILLWTEPSTKQWQWHWKDFFGWHTLRILVQQIARRSVWPEIEEAWRLVKKAASLVISALKLSEEKARLVGDLRMLIEAGDLRPSEAAGSTSYATGSMVPSIRPGMGTNPHNAMFPGMSSSFGEARRSADDKEGSQDPMPAEFDLKKINWQEMDRILQQLGTYTGS